MPTVRVTSGRSYVLSITAAGAERSVPADSGDPADNAARTGHNGGDWFGC